MKISKALATFGIAAILAACAQQEEAPEVRPQPVFDKYGGGECVEGYIYVPGSVPELAECIPEDECEELSTIGAANVPCPPPGRRGDDDNDDRGRQPGSGTTGGSTAPPGAAAAT